MDIDAFGRLREERWSRLRQLTRGRLTGTEADEITRLYQATAADLSAVKAEAPEPGTVERLSVLLANARIRMTGAPSLSWAEAGAFLARGVPAAMYRARWWAIAVFGLYVVAATAATLYIYHTPGALDLVGPPELRQQIAEETFADYYTEFDSTSFAASVFSNNAFLTWQMIVFGITLVYPVILFVNTVVQLAVPAAVMTEYDALDVFFQLIIPHGLLELTAAFFGAAVGLRLFWTMLAPGPARTRAQALGEEGRIAFAVAVGLSITLLVTGLVEGYVTGSQMPWPGKIAIGVVIFAAFWLVVFVVGRRAARAGVTGDVEGALAAARAPSAG